MGIKAILCKQVCRGALFDNLALIQDNNLLCPLSDGQAVGDENQGLVQSHEIINNPLLCQNIQTAGRLVQDQDRRICQESTRQSDSLTLST